MERGVKALSFGCVAGIAISVLSCSGKNETISCVTSFDCPQGWSCEDHVCVESPDTVPPDNDLVINDVFENDPVAELDTDMPVVVDEEMNDGVESDPDDDVVIESDDGTETPDETVDEADAGDEVDEDIVPVGDDAVAPTDDGAVAPDNVITDNAPDIVPDVDMGDSNPGATCDTGTDCHGDAVCADVFTNQLTSYCYLNCAAPNDDICNGTDWPDCTVVGSYALCLDIATIVGDFTAKVGSFQTGNNVSLTIAGDSTIQQACTASKNASNIWVLQCSYIVQPGPPKIQLDALFFWPEVEHAVGTVAGAEGQVFETTYNASNQPIDNWMRAFFLAAAGTLTLTQAGTANGATVAGSINFTGNAYDAQFAP